MDPYIAPRKMSPLEKRLRYWLSRKSMYYIINSKHFRLGNEDVLVGHVLNKHGIFPVEKTLKWETRQRKTVNKTKRNLLSVFWN
jgi:hypothetical protein